MPRPLSFVALTFAATLLACAPAVEPEPWVLPVADETRTIVLPPITPEQRAGNAIGLAEDRVIGARGDAEPDASILFGSRVPRVKPAGDGRVVILDSGNYRILVVSAAGELLHEFGRQGQGPGELAAPISMHVANGVIHVLDPSNARWSRWSLAGEVLESVRAETFGSDAVTMPGGEIVWREGRRKIDGREILFRRTDLSREKVVDFAILDWPERVIDPPLGEITDSEPDAWWVGTVPPAHAGAPGGPIYASANERYQIHAYDGTGQPLWALQRPGMRNPLSQGEIDYHMELHARRFPSRTEAQVDWPEYEYALAHLAVDGHGHLYVFPYVAKMTDPTLPRPVDVYSREGEPLFSGTMSGRMFTTQYVSYNGPMLELGWQASDGDFVWGVAESPTSGEYEVVRYRLEEPF